MFLHLSVILLIVGSLYDGASCLIAWFYVPSKGSLNGSPCEGGISVKGDPRERRPHKETYTSSPEGDLHFLPDGDPHPLPRQRPPPPRQRPTHPRQTPTAPPLGQTPTATWTETYTPILTSSGPTEGYCTHPTRMHSCLIHSRRGSLLFRNLSVISFLIKKCHQ